MLFSIYGMMSSAILGIIAMSCGVTSDEAKPLAIICCYLIGVALFSMISLMVISHYDCRPKKKHSFSENKYKSTLKEKL